jgi:hypothetical protein
MNQTTKILSNERMDLVEGLFGNNNDVNKIKSKKLILSPITYLG